MVTIIQLENTQAGDALENMESDQTDTGMGDQKKSQSSHTTETESEMSETSQAAATTPNKVKCGPPNPQSFE